MKKIILLVLAVILFGGIGFRIWDVNQAVELPPVNTYEIGEEVVIGDNIFLDDFDNMVGYTVTVNKAEILSYNDFMTKYNYNGDDLQFDKNDYFYPEMVYDLNLTVKNTNQTDDPLEHSGIHFLNYYLIGNSIQLGVSNELYLIANPGLRYGVIEGFRLQPDSEMDFNLPFYFSPSRSINPIQTKTVTNEQIHLVVSMYPNLNRILIE